MKKRGMSPSKSRKIDSEVSAAHLSERRQGNERQNCGSPLASFFLWQAWIEILRRNGRIQRPALVAGCCELSLRACGRLPRIGKEARKGTEFGLPKREDDLGNSVRIAALAKESLLHEENKQISTSVESWGDITNEEQKITPVNPQSFLLPPRRRGS